MNRWDHLPLVGRGATGEIRRDGVRAVKIAHSNPEARARLQDEIRLHRALERRGLPVPRLISATRRSLVREWIEGEAPTASPSADQFAALFALHAELLEAGRALEVRFDFSPSNLLFTRRGVLRLLDAGRRIAAPRFTAETIREFRAQWRRWFRNPPRPRVAPLPLPPSGRFHVETPVGRDPKSKPLWINRPLLRRWGIDWPDDVVAQLGHWSTELEPTTSFPATRYTDGVALDLRNGPRGDGRAISLGALQTDEGLRDLMAKGVGPTPLAWKGRAFHEDGRVSFPRTLWEVTVADELARLGFETPEYVLISSSHATTIDNTGRRWPAAVGVRASGTHWRLGHLRALSHRPEAFRALSTHLQLGRPSTWLTRFCDTLGHDVGRADALQIHCFNATPGNVRVDGHPLDYSTVRFHRHYLPHFRFLEGAWTVNRTRAVWSQQVLVAVEMLRASGTLTADEAERWKTRALQRFFRAYDRGALQGYAAVLGFDAQRVEARRFVQLTQQLRALRGDDTIRFEFFKQECPGPRFDLLGGAPEVVRAIRRRQPEPWRRMLRGDQPLSRDEAKLAQAWTKALQPLIKSAPARRWSELIRPWLEPEPLAALLYGGSTPRAFTRWKRRISSSDGLPEGHYSYREARALALQRGHVELETFAGTREVVVGLSPRLRDELLTTLRRTLGKRLVGVVVHGSRLVERRELKRRIPRAFTHGDLRSKGRDGVREYGPSREASSDLDLKIFITPGLGAAEHTALQRTVATALSKLNAWFPIGSWPRQRLIVTRHRDITRAFRAWNGAPRFAQLGKEPIPELQAAVLFP